ncbi:MAG: BCD family MFS transporter [Geminicoccaceae bacterium]
MSEAGAGPVTLSWFGIIRLGLVQTALGAIVVLTTATLNRVMVVELALPAMLPGALVALHYAVQLTRPRLGYGSDVSGRRTPWIIGGMACLCAGGVLATAATVLMATMLWTGIALAILAFVMIGLGVGAAGTSLLVLLAKRTDSKRRAPAATIVWLMMIAGFVVTAGVAGAFLDPFSPARLLAVASAVAAIAFVVAVVAVWGVEGRSAVGPVRGEPEKTPFREALAQVWSEPLARRFAVFVFVSMLAYSAQDLILEPFAGSVFGMTPGESTQLSGVQHGGVFVGMVLVGVLGSRFGRQKNGIMRAWAVGGCIASAMALIGLAVGGLVGPAWPLKTSVFALGVANGAFAVAAIGSMMGLVSAGRESREGVRMGLWGAAQAIAFGLGGFIGTAAIDLTRNLFAADATAYAVVFALEAVVFLVSGVLAAQVTRNIQDRKPQALSGERLAAI